MRFLSLLLCLLSLLLVAPSLYAEQIRVAVASNFVVALKAVVKTFEQSSGHQVVLISGSTGKLYAQIKQGAPFDLFFAADRKRPERLEKEAVALVGSRFTYAAGRVVLWSPEPELVDPKGDVLQQVEFTRLAMANPKLAPYGRATKEALERLGLWGALHTKMVRGENIGQAYQFVRSGSVKLGFVALSQVKQPGQSVLGSYWIIPDEYHGPITQQAVMLKKGQAATAFVKYVKSNRATDIFRSYGYIIPKD